MKKKIKTDTCSRGCSCSGSEALKTSPDAVLAVVILAIAADSKLARREMDDLEFMLSFSPLFREVEDIEEYLDSVAEAVSGKSEPALLAAAAELLSPGLRETAYAWAVYMVSADGKTVSPEHKFLSALRKAFNIHGVLAGKINSVVPMLNRAK